ncbi:MAG: hypothetical protein ACPGRD_09730 [Planktomarina sp.]
MEFKYNAKPWVMLLCALFFLACTLVLWQVAGTNDRGLRFYGIFTLGPAGATIFYYVLTALSAGFVMIGTWAAVAGICRKGVIVLSDTSITSPKNPMRAATVTIPYAQILGMRLVKVSSQQFLEVQHTNGKLTIQKQAMKNKAAFAELQTALSDRIARLPG